MNYLVWLNGVIVIALSVAFLIHFALIAYFGAVLIQEPHPIVLALEIALILLCITAGMVLLIKYKGDK